MEKIQVLSGDQRALCIGSFMLRHAQRLIIQYESTFYIQVTILARIHLDTLFRLHQSRERKQDSPFRL